MEIKKSTVKNVQGNGDVELKFGKFFKWEVEMTNGDAGQYLSKSQNQDKFKIGDVVDYEWTAGDFPKIKPHNTSFTEWNNPSEKTKPNGNDTQTQIIRQSSIRTAAEHCKGNCSIEDLIDNAEMIFNWCVDGSKPTVSNEKPY